MEQTRPAKDGTCLARVVFGIPPKIGQAHMWISAKRVQTTAFFRAGTKASFHVSRAISSSRPEFGETPNWIRRTQVALGRFSHTVAANSRGWAWSVTRLVPVFLCMFLVVGCKDKKTNVAARPGTARALFEQTVKEFHAPSAEAVGAERERLLNAAAKNYERLIKDFPDEHDWCAQSLRAIGSIHAAQGKANEAVSTYNAVGERYPECNWEVLQAWKAAGDLLWEANQRSEAKQFYAKIVDRFGKNEAPQIIQTVVRGSKMRLAE